MDEKAFSNQVYGIYSKLFKPYEDIGLKIRENSYILSDTTCLIQSDKYKLILGHSETDIVIFRSVPLDKKVFNSTLVRFYNDEKENVEHFKIPYIVIELKSGKLGSNSIQSKSLVAERIKSNFPFCAYYFIAQETTKTHETLLRQGKNFTNYFISKSTFTTQELTSIFNDFMRPHLANLEKLGHFKAELK